MALPLTLPSDKTQPLHTLDIRHLLQQVLQRENQLGLPFAHCWVVALGKDHKLLSLELVEMDATRNVTMDPLQVLRVPLFKKAASIILVHNRLEGTIEPSEEDKNFTEQLLQAGRIMKIAVLDHLILTPSSYYSFKEEGLLAQHEERLQYVPSFTLEKQKHQKAAILQEQEVEKKIQESFHQGREIGLEIGELRGLEKGIKEIAQQMLADKAPIEKIEQWTGMGEAELRWVQEDTN